jgi:hypothetical protein
LKRSLRHGIPAPGTSTSTIWMLALGFRLISAGSCEADALMKVSAFGSSQNHRIGIGGQLDPINDIPPFADPQYTVRTFGIPACPASAPIGQIGDWEPAFARCSGDDHAGILVCDR